MPRQITGFADNCWEILDDGYVVRRALDSSYKEHLLSGLTIEEILDQKMLEESLVAQEMPKSPRVFNIWTTYWSSKPQRPDFIEPATIKPLTCGRCRSKLNREWEWHTCLAWVTCDDCGSEHQVDPENDDHVCSLSTIDQVDTEDQDSELDHVAPYPFRNHRGKKATRRKQPKHVPKAQKYSSVLARGKIRKDLVPPTNSIKIEQKWEEERDNHINNFIDRLRWGIDSQYSWSAIDKIIQRFEQFLEPGDPVPEMWLTISPSIIKDYTPIPVVTRYFEWDEYSDSDDNDWMNTVPLIMFW